MHKARTEKGSAPLQRGEGGGEEKRWRQLDKGQSENERAG